MDSSPEHQLAIPMHLLSDAAEVPAGVTEWATWV